MEKQILEKQPPEMESHGAGGAGMREIKFRAWDKTENRMARNVEELKFNSKGIYAVVLNHLGFEMRRRANDVELMQYTGLKDKNGKEIYEGDVVRTHFSFGHEVTQEPFIIKWNKERAMFEGSKPKPLENDYLVTFSFFPEQRFLYEIIGNIHENPELLEVE